MEYLSLYGALGVVLLIIVGIFTLLWWLSGGWSVPLMAFFIFVCLILIGLILIQKPKGGGLAGAFGGAGGVQDVLGSKAGDQLTWATCVLFVFFISLGIALTLVRDADRASKTVVPVVSTTSSESAAPAVPPEPVSATAPSGTPATQEAPR